MDLKGLIQQLDKYADDYIQAPHFRARIHMAEHVLDSLDEIYQALEADMTGEKPAHADEAAQSADPVGESCEVGPMSAPHRIPSEGFVLKALRFRKMTMAEGAEALLREHGELHGKEIERLLKEGGYRTSAEHFQSSLAVALKREGAFENVGGNRWRLKSARSSAGPIVISANGLIANHGATHSEG